MLKWPGSSAADTTFIVWSDGKNLALISSPRVRLCEVCWWGILPFSNGIIWLPLNNGTVWLPLSNWTVCLPLSNGTVSLPLSNGTVSLPLTMGRSGYNGYWVNIHFPIAVVGGFLGMTVRYFPSKSCPFRTIQSHSIKAFRGIDYSSLDKTLLLYWVICEIFLQASG